MYAIRSYYAIYGANELKNIQGGLLLSGHIDTVPANKDQWKTDPFTPTEIDNKLSYNFV